MDGKSRLLLEKAEEYLLKVLEGRDFSIGRYNRAKNYVTAAAATAFGSSSNEYKIIHNSFGNQMFVDSPGDVNDKHRRRSIADADHAIKSIIEIYDDIYSFTPDVVSGVKRVVEGSKERVFLVHGHDELVRESVASFLRKIGLEVIILQEEAAGGATIIEKIERYSDVGFAVVLFTPDDVGGRSGGATAPRPRQNVVFEAGYFFGLITRSRVVVLYDEAIETISDLAGLNYIKLDGTSDWKLGLVRELRAANMSFDETRI